MTPQTLADLAAIKPEIWLTVAIVVTVIADLVVGRRARWIVGALGVFGCAVALWSLWDSDGAAVTGTVGRVFGLLSIDGYSMFFRTLIIAGTGLIVLHAIIFRGLEDSTRNEFVPMLLGTALGGCLLVSTDHLIMLLLSMELLSLNSYLLAGWQRRERRSSEAAMKYLVYGALASALMIFGFSLLFGISGSMSMSQIGPAVSEFWSTNVLSRQAVVVAATLLVFVGFGFKIAAFPFHFWAPDVYEGAPAPVTTFLAVSSKAAGFGLLVRFVDGVFLGEAINAAWLSKLGWMLAVLSAVTMTYGNITAVLQRNVKRLLAYSSIAHAGYLLMGVAAMTAGTRADGGAIGSSALLFYLASYYVATLGAFGCMMALANRFGAETTDDYQGLGWSAPLVSGLFVVFLFSLTGLPPSIGFIGKWKLLAASLDTGLYWLAFVAVLNTVVSLFYYFKVARALFLRGDTEPVPGLAQGGVFGSLASFTLVVLAVATVYLGLGFDGLADWVGRSLL